MPTFCRHNRFLERCPICSKELQGADTSPARRSGAPAGRRRSTGGGARSAGGAAHARARRGGRENGVRVRRQERAAEDGYSSALVPGLRASADAVRLAEEVAFCNGRLLALAGARPELPPPGLYAEVRSLLAGDLERATWACFLIAYLCPLERGDPFGGIRAALAGAREQLPELSQIALGPRASHDPARGTQTLAAYRRWAARAGSQAQAFTGDVSWSAERRFERVFERLALPGFTRAARYELLMLLGALGAYELQADSLHLSSARAGGEDATELAAKRVFAIGDPLLLERRARALADALAVPVGSLELALANWGSDERATLGFPAEALDPATLARAREALSL
jgi:Alpha-glutamyl/putrescinyl thymine pyrophosphorylase clade 3